MGHQCASLVARSAFGSLGVLGAQTIRDPATKGSDDCRPQPPELASRTRGGETQKARKRPHSLVLLSAPSHSALRSIGEAQLTH